MPKKVYPPKTVGANPQGLSVEGHKLESHALLNTMSTQAEQLTPSDAVRLAQRLLVTVDQYGIGYEDFQAAQMVKRFVRQAVRALRGLSLS